MRNTIMMGGLALMLAGGVQAATLNKCIDANGQVTYSNLPCRNARETRTVEIDPAPLPDPKPRVEKQPIVQQAPTPPAPLPVEPATTRVEIRTTGKPIKPASASQCDSLSDKLGAVFDKMDQARRKGYTQEQMNKWNQEIKTLETKKQQSGCF
jgi:hypothetical protein